MSGGAERTVIEHLTGRIDAVLQAKVLIMYILGFQLFFKFVFDNRPASYPTILVLHRKIGTNERYTEWQRARLCH